MVYLAMQVGLIRPIALKTFLAEIGQKLLQSCVVTNDLSQQKVIPSGSSTQEMRLRREISIIFGHRPYCGGFRVHREDVGRWSHKKNWCRQIDEFGYQRWKMKVKDAKFKNPVFPMLSEHDEFPSNHGGVTIQISDTESEKSVQKNPVPMSTAGTVSSQSLAVMSRKKPISCLETDSLTFENSLAKQLTKLIVCWYWIFLF